jgi:hypothetical protein
MSSRTLTIRFVGDSKNMSRAVKDIVSGLDDTESAGKRVASAMKQLAGDAETSFRDSRDAADKLAQALGPEMVSKIEAGGRSVDGYITELQRMGLTFDDIRTDVDELADAIRRVDTTRSSIDGLKAPLKDVDGGLREVRDSADQSGSVLANMVGNSVQDLGALGGVAGTAGMALGQFAEYATEGNISLSGLAKVAAPMVGVGLAIAGATWAIGELQQASEDAAEESANLQAALEANADGKYEEAAGILAEQYANTIPLLEKYGYSSQALADTLGGQGDIIEELNVRLDDVHERYQDVQLDAYNGDEAAQALSESLGLQSEELISLIDTLTGARDEYQGIAEDTANRTALEQDLAQALRISSGALGDNTTENERYKRAQDNARQAAQDRLDTERELYGFLLSQVDATRAYEVAVDQGEDAIRSFDEVLGESKSTLEEIDDAARNSADQLIAQADAFAKSKGAADGSKESVRLQIEELYRLASTMDPNSPLRSRLIGYIGELQRIPPTIDTMLRLRISQGAVTTKDGDTIGDRSGLPRNAGGPVWPGGVFAVGDNPDGSWNPTTELFVPNSAGRILSASESRSALGGLGLAGGGGNVTNLYVDVHVPPTVDKGAIGREVVEAVLAYQRESGPVFVTTR